jgi:hypothetical protein
MTVRVNKSSFNIREKLSELGRKFGLKGSELAAAETVQEARDLVSAGRKNLVINGAMVVAQRNTSVSSINTTGYYTTDRHQLAFSPGGAVLTDSRSTDSPEGFAFSKKLEVTTAGSTGGWLLLAYKFEGQDLYSINKGTSAAKPLTLSFWVKADHTADYVVELIDTDNDRIISYLYTINAANTWQKVEWNIPPDTTGALTLDNTESLQISWFLDPGNTFTGGTPYRTSWAARGSNANRAVGCDDFLDTVGKEFYLTGIQLEVGNHATDFEHRSYVEELGLCSRYFQRTERTRGSGNRDAASNNCAFSHKLSTTMRDTPDCEFITQGSDYNYSGKSFTNIRPDHVGALINITTADSYWYFNHGYTADAEL